MSYFRTEVSNATLGNRNKLVTYLYQENSLVHVWSPTNIPERQFNITAFKSVSHLFCIYAVTTEMITCREMFWTCKTLFPMLFRWPERITLNNKTVLLRDRKRRTARGVTWGEGLPQLGGGELPQLGDYLSWGAYLSRGGASTSGGGGGIYLRGLF